MIKFPMKFEAEASAPSGIAVPWTAQAGSLPPIPSAIPPEFMGPGAGYSPEDLFALALLNCLIASFKVYSEKSNAPFQEINGKIALTVDKIIGTSGFGMTQADIFLNVTGAADIERSRKILDSAIKDCAVSNSIKTGKTFHIHVA
ncbi:MAG: OsmC family protein [Chlamydiota bacterium]